MSKSTEKFEKNEKNEDKEKSPFDASNFQVIVFQPDEAFYKSDFKKRLEILEIKINLAKEYFKNNKDLKGIFVAPEYLFKNFSQTGENRYFTHEEKKKYIAKLKELSKDTDMIIAPGTICWKKLSKADKENYYRNELFLFHKDLSNEEQKPQKYKKTRPHEAYDYDYTGEAFVEDKDPRAKYFRKGNAASAIKDVGNLTIGTEICSDNYMKLLQKSDNSKNIDIQLIVADGIKYPNLVIKEDVLLIKIERDKSKYQNLIGTIKRAGDILYSSDAKDLGAIQENDDLHVFKFKK